MSKTTTEMPGRDRKKVRTIPRELQPDRPFFSRGTLLKLLIACQPLPNSVHHLHRFPHASSHLQPHP